MVDDLSSLRSLLFVRNRYFAGTNRVNRASKVLLGTGGGSKVPLKTLKLIMKVNGKWVATLIFVAVIAFIKFNALKSFLFFIVESTTGNR